MANESTKQGSGTVGLPPGTRIGKYEVKERLAIGGQAIIYKCYDSLLDRHVAVKQVSTHLAEDPKFLERFRKEAQILARLGARQPAIVNIYELLEDERGLFIVMEHIEGSTLEATLQENPQAVEPKAALQIVWRLAAALHDVHSAGIIHRDIKPGNIIIGDGLRPKITDFGVAASITGQTSMLLGTTRYMAPELLSGQGFDGRADMYSLGFIAYEMLVGRSKFNEIFADIMRDKHSEALRWMKWHSNQSVQAPAVSEINPAVPKSLSDIVAKMMAKDPAGRFASMEELGRAIKGSFSPRGKATEAPVPHKKHHRRKRPASPVVLAGDEGDELVVGGGPATAPIPKKQMSRRTKLALLGSLVGLLIIGLVALLVVKLSGERMASQERVALLRAGDDAYFTKGDYPKALKEYQELAKLYGATEEGARTSVMIPLTEAQVAILAGNWDQAAAKEDEARTARDKLNQRAKGSLLEWTRKTEEDIQIFSRYRTSMQDYDRSMKAAEAAFKTQKYDDARKAVSDGLRRDLKPELVQQLQAFQTKINAAEFKANIESMSKQAQDLSAAADYVKADKVLSDAMNMLSGEQAKSLGVDEVKGLKDSLESRRRDLDNDRKLATALAEVQQARNANDRRGEVKALEDALKIKADPALAAQLKKAQSQLALSDAQELELAKKFAEAREKYVESLRYEVNAPAQQGLERVASLEQRATTVEKANVAFEAGNYEEALKLYQEAYKDASIDDTTVKDRMEECQYRILLAEADRLIAAKEYDKAFAVLEKIRILRPKAESIVNEREARLKLDQEYETLMAEGNKLVEQGSYSKAIDQYTLAQKKKDTDEVKKALLNAKFMQSFTLGKDRMDKNDKPSALSYFKIARQYANDAQKKQVDELIKQLE